MVSVQIIDLNWESEGVGRWLARKTTFCELKKITLCWVDLIVSFPVELFKFVATGGLVGHWAVGGQCKTDPPLTSSERRNHIS